MTVEKYEALTSMADHGEIEVDGAMPVYINDDEEADREEAA